MNSPSAVSYYHGDSDFRNIMVQRHSENGDGGVAGIVTEYYPLTEAEAKLILKWASQVLDSKQFWFTCMEMRGWTIFFHPRQVDVTPLVLTRLIQAVARHEPMANDPAVIDAINAIEDALKRGDIQ